MMTDDVKAVAQKILDRTADHIGTHSTDCHHYHLPCFAAFVIRQLESATVAPAVDREALAQQITVRVGRDFVRHPDHHDYAAADRVIASGLLRDVRDVQAEALEKLADELDDSDFEEIHDAEWLRERAMEVREARSER